MDRRRDRYWERLRFGGGADADRLGYTGRGRYSSGDVGSGVPDDYDYDYAGYKGDLGFDEFGGNQYGGGRYATGPYEQSQQYGADDFSSGQGTFGSLQRQFENRYVSGGHRGSLGERYGYPGRADYSTKQHPEVDPSWSEELGQRSDTGNRRWDEGAYYDALSRDERLPRAGGYGGYSGALGGGYSPGDFGPGPDWRSAPDWGDPAGYRVSGTPARPASAAGRGPKGYKRSDERIHEDIHERLCDLEGVDAREVHVEVHKGTAKLSGSVPERRMKHAIEDTVADVSGVADIENAIRVTPQEEDPLRYSSAGS